MTDTTALAARRLARRRTLRAASERHVNYMLKKTEPGNEKAGFYREQVPGLTELANLGAEIRGGWWTGSRLFIAAGSGLYEVFSGWTSLLLGTMNTSTGLVDMAQGLLSLVVVDGPNGYVLTLADNTFARITDADFYGSETVSFLDGKFQFVRPDTQQWYWSDGIDDAATYDALGFESAESAPDDLVGHIVDHREIWLGGTKGFEVWFSAPSGDQVYARNNGATIEVGLAAAHTLKQVDNSVMWVGQDRNGQGIVWLAGGPAGYTPTRASSNELEDALALIDDLSEAYAWVYQDAGQTFYVLQVPGCSTSWVWDASTRKWHERAEHVAGALGLWRADVFVSAFGKKIVGDSDGKLYEIDPYEYTFDGDVIYREWTSPHAAVPSNNFVFFDALSLDITAGETASGADPQIEMRYSDDGGNNWGAWMARSTGQLGEFDEHVKWVGLGRSRARVWQFRCTDDAKVSIINMAVKAKEAA